MCAHHFFHLLKNLSGTLRDQTIAKAKKMTIQIQPCRYNKCLGIILIPDDSN